jgi:hypothetical protein
LFKKKKSDMQLVFSSAIFWLEHQRAKPRTQKAQICFNKKQKQKIEN